MSAAVAGTSQVATISIAFGGSGGQGAITVEAVACREAMSRPYECLVHLQSTQRIDPGDVLGGSVGLTIQTPAGSFGCGGVVLDLCDTGGVGNGRYGYRVLIGPKLSLLDLLWRNRIYGTTGALSVKDLIEQRMKGVLGETTDGISVPYELIAPTAYPSQDFIVQRAETDLAFLSRRCEHHGIFYFFRRPSPPTPNAPARASDDDIVVFGDNVAAYRTLPSALDYVADPSASPIGPVAIGLEKATSVQPGYALVTDHDTENPGVALRERADTRGGTVGRYAEAGAQFTTPDAGQILARARAQEIDSRTTVYRGESNAPFLRPGHVVEVNGYGAGIERLLVVAVDHEVVVSAPQRFGTVAPGQSKPYRNSFRAIPASLVYRPARITPEPVAAGLYKAIVEAAPGSDHLKPDLDEKGRYRVRVRFDESETPEAQASCRIRLATPYAGSCATGLHFPITAGTEVLLAFVDGHFDRPILVGGLHDGVNPNLVAGWNRTANLVRTQSGAMLEFQDPTS